MTAPPQPLLEVRDLTRYFGGLAAVDGVSFTVERGEVLGLVGPNGSGKSTALSLVSGRLAPMSGEVHLNGTAITGRTPEAVCRAGIAGTFQLARIPDALDARDNVAVAAMYGRRRLGIAAARAEADRLLDRVGFAAPRAAHGDSLTYFDHKRIELARPTCCCSTSGWPASTPPSWRPASTLSAPSTPAASPSSWWSTSCTPSAPCAATWWC